MTRTSFAALTALSLMLAVGCGGRSDDGSGTIDTVDAIDTVDTTQGSDIILVQLEAAVATPVCTEGESSATEGNPSCEAGPPAGGGCTCKNGAWDCWTSCHDSCPTYYDPSIAGTSCSFTKDEGSCIYLSSGGPYMQMTCDCVDGKLDCQGY